ncbi:hypothetical protein QYE76_001892 [Lolium multiflorum]|uniref:DDE Tnp4 domain-containing protein n=1 Tax=Lolium multiflorum TaxID=4521 RepID=A0AAD8RMY5_LOLMU|nr:hypothetical protein QYE76_001892 [Lolium multiflorum]
MLNKFRAEAFDSSSDEEYDQSTQTLATTAASMIHEFTSNPGPEHRCSVKGAPKTCATEWKATRLHKDYFHLTNPVFEKTVPVPVQDVKGPVLSHSTGRNYDPYFQCMPDATGRNPNFEKTRRFAKMQEACRKDVERGFGVLQAQWTIVRHPAKTWSLKTMHEVMTCRVIMHNMIVENERPDGRNENH